MKDFCLRLTEERKRLGLTQEEFGALGGVKKLAQFNYEKGERAPDSSYLTAIGKAGADVHYILFGVRIGSVEQPPPPPKAPEYSVKTQIFIQNYEALDEDDKRTLERMVDMASQYKERSRSVRRGK